MKKFKLVADGPVDVPALGLEGVTPGTHVEVEDPDVSASMEEQGDVWEHIPDPARSRAAKKAAASRADNEGEAS